MDLPEATQRAALKELWRSIPEYRRRDLWNAVCLELPAESLNELQKIIAGTLPDRPEVAIWLSAAKRPETPLRGKHGTPYFAPAAGLRDRNVGSFPRRFPMDIKKRRKRRRKAAQTR